MRGRALIVWALAAALAAAEPQLIIEPQGLARPGGLLRLRVAAAGVPLRGELSVTLRDGRGEALAATALTLPPHAEAWVVLVPERLGDGRLAAEAELRWALPGLPPRVLTGRVPVASPAGVLAEAAAAVQRLQARLAVRDEPLPWLWAEQIADLAAGPDTAARVARVAALGERIISWLERPVRVRAEGPWLEGALRDPVDGSVQPWRLALPAGRGPHPLALYLASEPATCKADWAGPPPALIAAATAQGLALLAPYPAGDAGWQGPARRRLPLAIDAAASAVPFLDAARGLCLVAQPVPGLPYPTADPASPPETWPAALGPRQPMAEGGRWYDAPFAIVVGTAEHRAAVAANRRLAESLRAAYAARAHAVVALADDTAAEPEARIRHLVLVGNPRSHRWLARWQPDLPWRWDHRAVRHRDGRAWLRSAQPLIVAQGVAPDGRRLWILDGPPPAAWEELLELPETP